MLHAWAHVDLDQPRVEILIDHEIITHKFTRAFLCHHMAFTTFNTPDHNVLNFLLSFQPFVRTHVFSQFLHRPHTFLNISLFVVLLHTIVCQMDMPVVNVVEREVISAKSRIALIIKPYFGRVEILDKDPLADVELLTFDQHWVLDVFLDHKLAVSSKTVVCYIV